MAAPDDILDLDPFYENATRHTAEQEDCSAEAQGMLRSRQTDTVAPDAMSDRDSTDEDAAHEDLAAEAQEMHFDDLCANGYAFARGATLLPMFQTTGVSLEGAWRKPLTGTCTQQERNHLEHALRVFLMKPAPDARSFLQKNEQRAYVLKTQDELIEAWDIILGRRRLAKPDDRNPITCPRRLADVWTSWMHEWLQTELTCEQRKKSFPKNQHLQRMAPEHSGRQVHGDGYLADRHHLGPNGAPAGN